MGTKPARLLLDPDIDLETTSAVLRGLQLPNGTRKTTWPNRFSDLDAHCVQALRDRGETLEVLDVAVSSGISTLELIRALTATGKSVSATATDLFIQGVLVTIAPGIRLLVDDDDNPIQWESLGRTLRAHPNDGRLDTLRALLDRFWRHTSGGGRHRRQVVPLVDPRLTAEADVQQEDLLNPNPALDGPFDLVRACNILNTEYFTVDELTRMTRVVVHRVATDGGILVIARTRSDGTNYGTIYRREDDGRLVVIEHIGEPCDVHEMCMDAGVDGHPGS